MKNSTITPLLVGASLVFIQSCSQSVQQETIEVVKAHSEISEYFLLRSGMDRSSNCSHAIKMGNDIIISGNVKKESTENSTSVIGSLEQHLKNSYSDFENTLDRYIRSMDDEIVKNMAPNNSAIYTEYAVHSNHHYKKPNQ